MSAEQEARVTAARAILGDFRSACRQAPLSTPPRMGEWALRLASALGTVLDSLDDVAAADDDDTEPYCTACREWVGMFLGLEGWRHFRGDWAPGGVRTLFDADHEAAVGWTVPPGRGLSPAGLDMLRETLGDDAVRRLGLATGDGQ